jgi:hypothetical protein
MRNKHLTGCGEAPAALHMQVMRHTVASRSHSLSHLALSALSSSLVSCDVAIARWWLPELPTSNEAHHRLGLLDGQRYSALEIPLVEHGAGNMLGSRVIFEDLWVCGWWLGGFGYSEVASRWYVPHSLNQRHVNKLRGVAWPWCLIRVHKQIHAKLIMLIYPGKPGFSKLPQILRRRARLGVVFQSVWFQSRHFGALHN